MAILSLLALVAALPSGDDCVNWAKGGECTKNTQYMQEFCADACSKHSRPLDAGTGEPEQCVGWAEQGECTRNVAYMTGHCPHACAEPPELAPRAAWAPSFREGPDASRLREGPFLAPAAFLDHTRKTALKLMVRLVGTD